VPKAKNESDPKTILMCHWCKRENYEILVNLKSGDALLAHFFKGIPPIPDPVANQIFDCRHCGKDLMNERGKLLTTKGLVP